MIFVNKWMLQSMIVYVLENQVAYESVKNSSYINKSIPGKLQQLSPPKLPNQTTCSFHQKLL